MRSPNISRRSETMISKPRAVSFALDYSTALKSPTRLRPVDKPTVPSGLRYDGLDVYPVGADRQARDGHPGNASDLRRCWKSILGSRPCQSGRDSRQGSKIAHRALVWRPYVPSDDPWKVDPNSNNYTSIPAGRQQRSQA